MRIIVQVTCSDESIVHIGYDQLLVLARVMTDDLVLDLLVNLLASSIFDGSFVRQQRRQNHRGAWYILPKFVEELGLLSVTELRTIEVIGEKMNCTYPDILVVNC